MIQLNNVSLYTPGLVERQPILLDATARFLPGERVGILAHPGSGKSSLARLLSGIDFADTGTVTRQGRVSWPIGFAGFLHPRLSVRDNLVIFARMTGLSADEVFEFCEDFTAIDGLHYKIMQDLTPTQRAILGYACALCVPGPAMWIADEVITVGEPRDRALCDQILSERLSEGGLVFLSRNVRQLKLYCSRFYVLIQQRLLPVIDLDVAKEALDYSIHSPATRH